MFTRSMLVYFRPGPNLGVVWALSDAESRTAVASVEIIFIGSLIIFYLLFWHFWNTVCLPEHRKLVKRIIVLCFYLESQKLRSAIENKKTK
jgi:hypothetical protein